MALKFIFVWIEAYARHAGLGLTDAEIFEDLQRRLSLISWWAGLTAAMGASLIGFVLPFFWRGRRSFDSLTDDESEEYLQWLQNSRNMTLKKLFFAVKSLTLAVCYGQGRQLAKLGYQKGKNGAI